MKERFKIIKYFIIALLILIPGIKLFLDLQFGITLLNDDKIIYTYIAIYSILAIVLVFMMKKFSYMVITIIFLFIYVFTLYIGNGLDDRFRTSEEYISPNNENILIVNIQTSWYPSANVKFYKKVGSFFKKTIKVPKIEGEFNDDRVIRMDISWEDDDTAVISGFIVKRNRYKLEKIKENFPDKCDYETIDNNLYLKLE